MRYASIRKMDITNGTEIGVALFVQGCPFHCKGCFNPETWDFNDGKEWTPKVQEQFFKLIDYPYIKRVSILGGEPLVYTNLLNVYEIIKKIKNIFPNKKIWLWTGYTWESLNNFQKETIGMIDVLIDGQYQEKLRDISLPFRGSSNQRVIDVKRSLETGHIELYNEEK